MAAEIEKSPVAPAEAERWPQAPVRAACPDPSGPAIPVPGEPPSSGAVVDAHLVWERQLAKLGSIDLRLVDEPVLGAVCDQMDHLEGLILTTPARTLKGAVVQLRRVAASMAHNDGDPREQRGLRLALATLTRLRSA
jgi:hypothetical protein